MTPSQVFDDNLSSLVMCRMVTFSLEHGNCDASCFAYVWFAMFGGPRFDHYKEGFGSANWALTWWRSEG